MAESNYIKVELQEAEDKDKLTLVARKSCFGLPTACPACLPVYMYLRFARIPFQLGYNLIFPDSDQVPYVESGTYVAYNNEKGGVIESLKKDGVVDLDSIVSAMPEWVSTRAMVDSWLSDALLYELWIGTEGGSVDKIYYSDLPWPMGKVLFLKQLRTVRQELGITKDNADRREEEIYSKAKISYGALSTRLGDQQFLFENRPTSLDAIFASHVLLTLNGLPETSVLRGMLLEHSNLVTYAENLKMQFIDLSSASSIPQSPSDPSSSAAKQGPSKWSSKPKPKPKREKTEEEKKFRRRAKYFLVTQMVAVLVFLSLLGGSEDTELELDEDDDGLAYE